MTAGKNRLFLIFKTSIMFKVNLTGTDIHGFLEISPERGDEIKEIVSRETAKMVAAGSFQSDLLLDKLAPFIETPEESFLFGMYYGQTLLAIKMIAEKMESVNE